MFKYKLKENSKFEVGDVKIKDGTQSTISSINPTTGAITWDLEDVGAFDTVYKTFDKLNQLIKTLESEGEAEADPKIDSIAEKVKNLFNDYRTHIRRNYPEAYERVKLVKEESINENGLQGPETKDVYEVGDTIIYRKGNVAHSGTVELRTKDFNYYVTDGSDGKGYLVKMDDVVGLNLEENEGIGYLTPNAFSKKKKSNNTYKYKLSSPFNEPVPKKIKGSGLEVKQLFEKEELTEYSDFQQKRINIFDDVEGKINSLSPLLSNAKNETAKYYNENPGSYAIVYSTDMVNELLDDITELLKQEE